MKKRLSAVLWVVLAIVVLIGAFLGWYYWIRPLHIGDFTLSEYSRYVEEFGSDKTVGPISNAREAREKGVAVLEEVYGKDKIRGQVPFIVSYDQEADAWLISGSAIPIPFLLGGSAQIIINGADGDVLAVWHYR